MGVLKVGAGPFGVFDERENKALPISFNVPPSLEVRTGDFIMSRANTVELVGACALVRKTRPKLMLSDKTFRFVFSEQRKVLPEYLEQVLKLPALREQIERGASGTSPTMKNISKEKVMALRLPPHALAEQRRIVAELVALQAEVDALKRLQAWDGSVTISQKKFVGRVVEFISQTAIPLKLFGGSILDKKTPSWNQLKFLEFAFVTSAFYKNIFGKNTP